MAARPNNNNNNNNNNKNEDANNRAKSLLMGNMGNMGKMSNMATMSNMGNMNNENGLLAEFDDAQYAAPGSVHRGNEAMGMMPLAPMSLQDSLDNKIGAQAVRGGLMGQFAPKQMHRNWSIPNENGMGNKLGSYTMEASELNGNNNNNNSMKESMIAQSEMNKDSLLAAQNNDIIVKKNEKNENIMKNIQEMKNDEMGKNEKKEESNDNKNDNNNNNNNNNVLGYRNPIDSFLNSNETPLILNETYSYDVSGSSFSCDKLRENVSVTLNEIVKDKMIDWDYETKYCFNVRVYKNFEDSGARIIIYEFEEDVNEYLCCMEVRRNGGDAFLFQEFKSKFLGLMSDSKAIDYEKGCPFTMEHGFLSMDFSELPPLQDSDILSDTTDDFSFLTPLSSMSNDSNGNSNNNNNNNNNNEFDALGCVNDAIDCRQYRELYRENVGILRNASNDDNKLQSIIAVPNVITKLLAPISGDRQIFDTVVIKLILEVIYKIACVEHDVFSSSNKESIRGINEQWNKAIPHPLSQHIEAFFPSQQIQWISHEIIDTLN